MRHESELVPSELIQSKIIVLRSERVMIDRDLAELYGVSTKALNQAATRNRKRFPPDFMFRLLRHEKEELVTNCDRFHALPVGQSRKQCPWVSCGSRQHFWRSLLSWLSASIGSERT